MTGDSSALRDVAKDDPDAYAVHEAGPDGSWWRRRIVGWAVTAEPCKRAREPGGPLVDDYLSVWYEPLTLEDGVDDGAGSVTGRGDIGVELLHDPEKAKLQILPATMECYQVVAWWDGSDGNPVLGTEIGRMRPDAFWDGALRERRAKEKKEVAR